MYKLDFESTIFYDDFIALIVWLMETSFCCLPNTITKVIKSYIKVYETNMDILLEDFDTLSTFGKMDGMDTWKWKLGKNQGSQGQCKNYRKSF